jgi:hypothetical protein
MAVTGTADLIGDRIKHLVYLDAFVLESGECALDILPQGAAGDRLRGVKESGLGIAMPVPPIDSFPLPQEVREWLSGTASPSPSEYIRANWY